MSGSRLAFLVPLVGVLALLRLLSGSAPDGLRPAAAPLPSSAPAACASDGCGCPHEARPTDCCCASEDVPALARARAARRPLDPLSTTLPATTRREPSHATLSAARCAGARRSRAASAPVPAAIADRAPVSGAGSAPREGHERILLDPPGELDREPLTPPPRAVTRA